MAQGNSDGGCERRYNVFNSYLSNKQQDFREFACKNVVLLVKPIAFLAFSSPSSSSITRRARTFHVVIVQ